MGQPTGAHVIARALHDLGVTVIFGLVGIPVVDIAEQAINLGIRFIALRNEQSCSYAATAYGYITGKPGVCLLVGGPGILHGMAGIGNASENAWPTLFLGGNSETTVHTKGGFQEMDAISLLSPHTKKAIRPASNDPAVIVSAIHLAYRTCWYGRPGPSFVDLPGDLIMERHPVPTGTTPNKMIASPPKPSPDPALIRSAGDLLRSAKAPLVIIGKGAAYAQAEIPIRHFINSSHIPFLPTPMGKGVMPDSSPLNTSSARSTALKDADVILLLGARLNWILHHGVAPKYRHDVKIIQVDISPQELGRTNSNHEQALGIFADIGLAVSALSNELTGWQYLQQPTLQSSAPSTYASKLVVSASRNEANARRLATTKTPPHQPLTFQRAFHLIRKTIEAITPPSTGDVVYIAEGSNTMDISRPLFPLELPRQKLDAGTYATMGVGMAYAVAAWSAYNLPPPSPSSSVTNSNTQPTIDGGVGTRRKKKIVAFEGDSAFGFSGMEIETMARNSMDVLIIVMNNSGIYHGDTADKEEWHRRRRRTATGTHHDKPHTAVQDSRETPDADLQLRSTSLWHEARYEMMAEMVGGKGHIVRTEEELTSAVDQGFRETEKVVLINVIVEPGRSGGIQFKWQQAKEAARENSKESKL